jgi:hypothetical protein
VALRRRKQRERLHRRRCWPLPWWVLNKWRWWILFVFRYVNLEFYYLFYLRNIFCLRWRRFQVRKRSMQSEELAVRQKQGMSRRFRRSWMRWVAHARAISNPRQFTSCTPIFGQSPIH